MMMQIVEGGDDFYEPRFSSGSMGCLFPPFPFVDSPRKSLYNKLQKQPLRLNVLKLDGSSFEIEVAKMGTVAELKVAVEAAFDHLPKMGPGRVSWEHLWGQFCLCHEGQKLLCDSDYIGMLGIRDGDQLQFVHHATTTCNFVKLQSKREDLDMDDVPRISNVSMDSHKNREVGDVNNTEITEENHDDLSEIEEDIVSRREHRLSHLFKGWFPYRKLGGSRKRYGERSSSARISRTNMLGSFKNCIRFSSNKYDYSRRLSCKRK